MAGPTVAVPSQECVLVLEGVSKSFASRRRGEEALRAVSLRVPRGGVTGLMGPDGAGKTTLLRVAAGLIAPDTGRVEVVGLSAVKDPLSVQSAIGYMPQRFGLYEDLSVQENLDLYSDLQGVPVPLRHDRYDELMTMTGLAPFTTRLAGRLSGGMKQKLGLACTLVRSPQLLLLDEPTVGVDPVSRRELWRIVDRFVREHGTTVVLSTAYLDEATHCNAVVILDRGEVIGHGPPNGFSDAARGRTFRVSAPGLSCRHLQATLADHPGVVDAVVDDDCVRVLAGEAGLPAATELLPEVPGVSIRPAPPRFEDGFIDLVRQRGPGDASRAAALRADVPDERPLDPRGPRASGPVIDVRDVKRRFGNFEAVKGVTFEVSRGEVFGLLGANGAGKTTTFRMLCGLLPASSGRLRVAGLDMRRAAASARARIGYMSQHFSLYRNLSVVQNLRFFARAYGLAGRRRSARLDWSVQEFELGDVADATSGALPLGYKQRLALACALIHEPEILFLDEPTSGVDPLARRVFWHRINTLAEAGVTILVTTHFMQEADYCDRMAIMDEGSILAMGTPAEIKAAAGTPQHARPTMEDAFIELIESHDRGAGR